MGECRMDERTIAYLCPTIFPLVLRILFEAREMEKTRRETNILGRSLTDTVLLQNYPKSAALPSSPVSLLPT